MQNTSVKRTQNVIVIIPRHNSDVVFREACIGLLRERSEPVRLLSLQPDNPEEQETLALLKALRPDRIHILPAPTLHVLALEVAEAAHVLTQRYHGAIAAISLGVPVTIVPQKEGDKLWALRAALETGDAVQEVARSVALALEGEAALRDAMRQLQMNRHSA